MPLWLFFAIEGASVFNIVMRLLFALSSISPILVATGLIGNLKGSSDIGQAVAMGVTGVALFLVGGIFFLRLANRCGESVSIEGAVSSVVPSGQWLSVLFGSYLVPLVSLFESAISLEWIVVITITLVVVVLVGQNIPPAFPLLFCGYRFYELSFDNGAGGYKLISKRRIINDPRTIKHVVRLFDNEYWLLESE